MIPDDRRIILVGSPVVYSPIRTGGVAAISFIQKYPESGSFSCLSLTSGWGDPVVSVFQADTPLSTNASENVY